MANSSATPSRPGLPADKAVLAVRQLTPRGPDVPSGAAITATLPGVRGNYRILRTDEVDAKDDPLPPDVRGNIAATAMAAATRSAGDEFEGTARKAAKLSISNAAVEQFADVKALIATLPAKKAMIKHKPHIGIDAASGRVAQEERNVRLRAFIYAASRENDNDFHLIVGLDPKAEAPMYITMELSALPPQGAASFARLKAARDAFKAFFGSDLAGASYDFYDPPIPIEVQGSLFFDMSHATGRSPGPPSLHDDMPVIWELHPITEIIFEP